MSLTTSVVYTNPSHSLNRNNQHHYRSVNLKISVVGDLPLALATQNIPVYMSVHLPEKYAVFALPIIQESSGAPSTEHSPHEMHVLIDAGYSEVSKLSSLSENDQHSPSDLQCQDISFTSDIVDEANSNASPAPIIARQSPPPDIPISFLPLSPSFPYIWNWGLDVFLIAFVSAYPTFPQGDWPAWDSRIPLEGRFIVEWMSGIGQRNMKMSVDDDSVLAQWEDNGYNAADNDNNFDDEIDHGCPVPNSTSRRAGKHISTDIELRFQFESKVGRTQESLKISYMAPGRAQGSSMEHQKFRQSIVTALEEDEDPLAAYDDYIKYTLQHYGEQDPASGLVELLDEATRKFRDDPRYKGDLRYLKQWSCYAKQVEKPARVYAFLVANGIGSIYALLYEEYALALEKEGRHSEAEKIFKAGISRHARPIERLKRRYQEFKARPSSSKLPVAAPFRPSGSSEIDALRRDPFKNHSSSASTISPNTNASSSAAPPSISISPGHDRYAPMLAPPVPGKRPEKLRFNLSLLFTAEGVEYSAAEVRARSIGLLGKKWGPPPPSEMRNASASAIRVNFNDDGGRSTQNMSTGRRRSLVGGAEPTVTINTKEALADVFGMYNSPDKTVKRMMPGSKHAPVRKIEPVTPMIRQPPPAHTDNNENAKTPVAFKPFVDENANRKENPATSIPKFKPFVDVEQPKQTFVTPEVSRRGLSVKDSALPTSALRGKPSADESTPPNADALKPSNMLKPLSEEGNPNGGNVFSRVFTPVSQKEPLTRPSMDEDSKTSPPASENFAVFQAPKEADVLAPPSVFIPFVDNKTPFKVFSRPPTQTGDENVDENPRGAGAVFTPKPRAFKPFVDNEGESLGKSTNRAPLGQKPAFEIPRDVSSDSADNASVGQGTSESDEQYEEEFIEEGEEPPISSSEDQGDSQSEQFEEEGELQSYREPLGGRFGRINVMTPITERTFEFTSSTRGFPTPKESDAVQIAERLAAELREENEREGGNAYDAESDSSFASFDRPGASLQLPEGPVGELEAIEERTGTLSFSDTLAAASSFRPPNPCNPFDPAIMSILLSMLPQDNGFRDLRFQEAKMLDGLQKFAQKKGRRGSGSSARGMDDDLMDGFTIVLQDKKFKVVEKLGEGGFGAVFAARDLSIKAVDDDDDDDDDEDEDDEGAMIALKIVRPRNLWEFHALRRIHQTLPEHLRRSIVLPHTLYAFRDESYLLLDLCPQGTLLDIVNRAGSAGISQQGACLDELLVMFFTIELLRFLEGMHSAGFIHGDLKIDNCLLRLEDLPGGASTLSGIYQPSGEGGWKYKGIKVIDFGRAIDTSLFPSKQLFIADWPTDARDCLEIRENRPWTYQTDYFGLAGIIYCMLYGKYIESASVTLVPSSSPESSPRYKIATPLKRYWQNELWTALFDILLNPCLVRPDEQLPICAELGEIREEMEIWLQSNCNRSTNSLKGLLKKIEVSLFTR
ncbi:hypothetical protein SERLA73DRAFT_73784 [Serpula lacrymans var. lacrymans S7.3]|uniref:Protein kinase domain-containing protein n=2 Tax=Serpula lacrymans var. lacrymans TaxID=341189 RepID=F8PWR9_SERL3|nr:uncharacterized protein SERLADRAFT_438414 [Serpula lacrymans var. lacrymans S7.9]EGN99246.1 hypothetical protein SERLA73DRAFT_73784 [Serpula lacrymans var. lacrymans S7.3]EGO24812.1 hypothetical protein SERLADRAFT_438414 [Serpula lacrymans var. lacrymans S7.9]